MKRLLPLLILLLLNQVMLAQSLVLHEQRLTETLLMKNVPGMSGSQGILNGIIQELAKGQHSRTNPEFNFTYEQYSRISKTGNKLQLELRLNKATTTGHTSYRGFNMADVLVPRQVEYTVLLTDASGKAIRSYPFKPLAIEAGNNVLADFLINDTIGASGFRLKLYPVTFSYTSQSRKKFDEKQALVEVYYKTDAPLAQAFRDLQNIHPEDLDHLPAHAQQLTAIENFVDDLDKQEFGRKLDLTQHDPVQFKKRFKELDEAVRARRVVIDQALANVHIAYYNRGLDALVKGNPKAAGAFFQKSADANPVFAPAHLQLAKLDFVNGYLKDATLRTRDVLSKMNPDPQTRQLAQTLMSDIYSAHLSQATDLTDKGQFQAALAKYDEVEAICRTTAGLTCNSAAIFQGMSRAKNGLYTTYLDEAQQSLRNSDLSRAEQRVQEALAFQGSNRDFISSNADAIRVLTDIKYQYYLRHISAGKKHAQDKKLEDALGQFDAALALEKDFHFEKDLSLLQESQKVARLLVQQKLDYGNQTAAANRLDDARRYASDAVQIQAKYGLASEQSLTDQYRQLMSKIATQECINTQTQYDKHLLNAQRYINEKKYLAAEQAFDEAIKTAQNMSDCGISTKSAEDGKYNVLPAISYQKLVQQTVELSRDGKNEQALQKYLSAEQYFARFEVQNYGLSHTDLFTYALNADKPAFQVEVAKHLLGKVQEQQSVELLASAIKKGYPKYRLKDILRRTGSQLAQRDYKTNPNGNPRELSCSYINGNKAMKQFVKGYVKQWKKLD
ncbi:MAG: hypothetical protein LPJ89_06310 [Hymenobacteraceae bacterium]|nr:hypothetical protein [Hymenobacteraceae bacterium]